MRIQAGIRDFSLLQNAHTGYWARPASFSGCWVFAPGYSGRVFHLPSSSYAAKNEWILTSASPACLCSVDNYTFTHTFISKNTLQPLTLYKVKHQMVPRKRGFYFPSCYVTSVITGLCLASCPSVIGRSQCTCLVCRKQFRMVAVSGLASVSPA